MQLVQSENLNLFLSMYLPLQTTKFTFVWCTKYLFLYSVTFLIICLVEVHFCTSCIYTSHAMLCGAKFCVGTHTVREIAYKFHTQSYTVCSKGWFVYTVNFVFCGQIINLVHKGQICKYIYWNVTVFCFYWFCLFF